MNIDYKIGDCREVLKDFEEGVFDACVTDPPYGLEFMGKEWDKLADDFEDDSVDLVPTSPPYWGLRDYGGGTEIEWPDGWIGQLGLEPTWQLYVQHMVEISKEIKRVLKPTGSYYLVLGDTYASGKGDIYGEECSQTHRQHQVQRRPQYGHDNITKPKQKLLIPYRVAIGLQEDGWICRNDITWRKPNAMPSSVKDRLTCTTERIFHFVKARKYFYDLDAIRKPHAASTTLRAKSRGFGIFRRQNMTVRELDEEHALSPAGKNPGDAVETKAVGTPYEAQYRNENTIFGKNRGKQGHPAGRNPGDSVETRQKWEDVPGQAPVSMARKRHSGYFSKDGELLVNPLGKNPGDAVEGKAGLQDAFFGHPPTNWQRGGDHPMGKNPGDYWSINTQPFPQAHFAVFPEALIEPIIKSSCPHDGVVLDPFCGSGTTNLVAMKLGRASIGIDINADYIKIAQKRCHVDIPSLQDFGGEDE